MGIWDQCFSVYSVHAGHLGDLVNLQILIREAGKGA